ncbi:MAG: dehydrogenase E1 component subunit alpha/beta [Ignavibacteria bacterium]|nr:dehydrogenase E1 component subunit alpha/beta [Ignavibacteria bacterium]
MEKNNYISLEEQIITRSIAESFETDFCVHNRGPQCSRQPVLLKKDVLPHLQLDLSKEYLLKAYKIMLLGRLTDEKHLKLLKQGKSFFHIGGSGHEAIQAAIGLTLRPGKDWFWLYYRDVTLAYALGITPYEYFLAAFGKPSCVMTGGRQMPGHYGHPKLNIPTSSSPTGTQFLNAVGTAKAAVYLKSGDITYVDSGEGATSEGEFYEAVNWATRERLPLIFCIQDNKYAISVPREHQGMGETVGHSFCCYANLKIKTFDGTNFFESLLAAREAFEYTTSGCGPVLLHALVERLLPHSSSDDHRKYRSPDDLQQALSKDPIKRLESYLLENKLANSDELSKIQDEVGREIDEAVELALIAPEPNPEDAVKHVFAPKETMNLPYSSSEPQEGPKIVMVDAINHALHEEMEYNPKMLIFGEDIADPKGGVFTATKGLSNKFGTERVFNSPLAEASIAGVALGLALRGFKPVVEMQFGDYIWPAFMQIKNEIATMRYRSNGNFTAPVVIRVAVGGYIHGGLYHSQNIESIFAHIPGLLIAYPSTAADAKGLLKTACRLQDPVIFCEHKGLYRHPFSSTPEPDKDYLIPFGKGKIVQEGSDLTIITWGMGVKDSIAASRKIMKQHPEISIEIIDLRTIIPWDKELVFDSVKKTNRAIIVHEDTWTNGFGAEIGATIAQEMFNYLDAPVYRVASFDSHIPYNPIYENYVLVNEDKIYQAIQNSLKF